MNVYNVPLEALNIVTFVKQGSSSFQKQLYSSSGSSLSNDIIILITFSLILS